MMSKVKETNESNSTDQSPRVDPVTMSVIHGALDNIATEMGFKLMRMSYSSIIRESEDFGAALCDAQGRQLCECSKSTPLQSGPIPGYIRGIQKRLAERGETVQPGDIILHNDPYYGASHSPDLGFCIPVFYQNELVGFSMTTAHHLDIGSAQPGSMGLVKCADRYAEGLCFCAIKVSEAGKRNDMIWQLIRDNIRVTDLVVGDMEAQISACQVGVQRYLDLIEKYSLSVLRDAVEDLFDYSERLMRGQIAKIPDGDYSATGHIDGFLDSDNPDHKLLPIKVTLSVSGSDMKVDFAGSADQLEGTSINLPFIGTVDVATWLTLRTVLLDTDIYGNVPQNDGLYRPITITAPEGSIVNPISPIATISRATGGNRVADTVMRALSQALPQQVCAGVGSLKGIAFTGMLDGQQWVHLEIFEGSYGGRFGKDGMDCVDTLYANTRNNPVEDVESHVPLRVTRYEFRDGTVAAGKWRGGTNSVKEIEFLSDGAISVEGDNHAVKGWGFDGGQEGITSELILQKPDGSRTLLPSMCPQTSVEKGDVVIAIGGTGGGYGDPLQRDADKVLADYCDGLISTITAKNEYGVIINADKQIDNSATSKQRSNDNH